jgi:hypothetical protein
MNSYVTENDSNLDLKELMYRAFSQAHPKWKILEISLHIEK